MGCCSSKKKKVEQPVQTKRTEEEPQEITERKNIEITSNIDHRSTYETRKKPIKEKERKAEVNTFEVSRTQVEEKKKTPEKPKLSEREHAKLLAKVEEAYRQYLDLLSMLKDNLTENETKEDDTLADIIEEIKLCCQEIERHLDNLKLYPFLDDKERLREYAKAVQFSAVLDQEYTNYRKGKNKYVAFRRKILNILEKNYPFLFEKTMPLPVSVEPSPKKSSPEKSVEKPKKLTPYDEAFDREMAIIMHRERDNAIFELEGAVNEYNRLIEDFNRLRQQQKHLNGDVAKTRQEIREMKNVNSNLAFSNETLGVENDTFKNIHGDMLKSYNLSKESCVELQNDLEGLHKRLHQNYIENQYVGQEFGSRIRDLERVAYERRREANELERRYQEDLRRYLNQDKGLYAPPRFDPLENQFISQYVPKNPAYEQPHTAYFENQERGSRRSEGERKSVFEELDGQPLENINNALDQARKSRIETDQNWEGDNLELKRLELYSGLSKEELEIAEQRMSAISGRSRYAGSQRAQRESYNSNRGGEYGRSSYNQQDGYNSQFRGRESAYMVGLV